MRTAICDFALLVSSLAASVLAQPVVPVEQEPRHRTAYENAWLRVLDVRFDAGMASLFHRHALNNVAVRIVGGTTRADPVDGEGRPLLVPTGRVVFYLASPPYVHRVVNVGAAAVHIVDVELLGARPVQTTGTIDDMSGHVVEIENEHVRVSRVRLGPGVSLPAHTHARGWLDVVIAGEVPGSIAWHDAARPVAISGRPAGLEYVEIEPK
jgi:hypothetical protein